METFDRAEEFRRVNAHYQALSDGELQFLARQQEQLTDVAQQALKSEISRRGLTQEPEEPPAQPKPDPRSEILDPDDPDYDEDRHLVPICRVCSLRDALQLQNLLDRARIPFFAGRERASRVDGFTNFEDGVEILVMAIGEEMARQAMSNYKSEDALPEKKDLGDMEVRCPKCRSTDVVFEGLIPGEPSQDSTERFRWTCDSCRHSWEDNGIEKVE